MRWTGMSYTQIQHAFDRLPRYKWSWHRDEFGNDYQMRHLVP